MIYSDDIIEEVRGRSDIVDVISGYVRLTRKGSSYFGLCPFHNEKSPSFSVSGSKQMFYCFGCGEGGNVFSFIMKYENYTFPEAVKMLADRAGVQLPEVSMSPEERKQQEIRNEISLACKSEKLEQFESHLEELAQRTGGVQKAKARKEAMDVIVQWKKEYRRSCKV